MTDTENRADDESREDADPAVTASAAEPEHEAAPETARAPDPDRAVPASGRTGAGVAWLALLIALAAAAAAGWPYYRAWQAPPEPDPRAEREALAAELRGLIDRQAGALRTEVDEREAQLAARARSVEEAGLAARREAEAVAEEFDALRRGFETLSAQVARQEPVDERAWRIAEAEYLLRIANQRARMEGDADGALTLLLAADEVLAELDDYGLFAVREAIAAAVTDLRSVEGVDRVGLYLQLEGLSARIDALPVIELAYEMPQAGADDAAPEGPFEPVWRRLSTLLDFRINRPEPTGPLIRPENANFLRHNLRLKLEQAQLALLAGRQSVWADSLMEAAGWLRQYFDPEATAVAAQADALEALAAVPVAEAIPDISAPLTRLVDLRGRAEDAGS